MRALALLLHHVLLLLLSSQNTTLSSVVAALPCPQNTTTIISNIEYVWDLSDCTGPPPDGGVVAIACRDVMTSNVSISIRGGPANALGVKLTSPTCVLVRSAILFEGDLRVGWRSGSVAPLYEWTDYLIDLLSIVNVTVRFQGVTADTIGGMLRLGAMEIANSSIWIKHSSLTNITDTAMKLLPAALPVIGWLNVTVKNSTVDMHGRAINYGTAFLEMSDISERIERIGFHLEASTMVCSQDTTDDTTFSDLPHFACIYFNWRFQKVFDALRLNFTNCNFRTRAAVATILSSYERATVVRLWSSASARLSGAVFPDDYGVLSGLQATVTDCTLTATGVTTGLIFFDSSVVYGATIRINRLRTNQVSLTRVGNFTDPRMHTIIHNAPSNGLFYCDVVLANIVATHTLLSGATANRDEADAFSFTGAVSCLVFAYHLRHSTIHVHNCSIDADITNGTFPLRGQVRPPAQPSTYDALPIGAYSAALVVVQAEAAILMINTTILLESSTIVAQICFWITDALSRIFPVTLSATSYASGLASFNAVVTAFLTSVKLLNGSQVILRDVLVRRLPACRWWSELPVRFPQAVFGNITSLVVLQSPSALIFVNAPEPLISLIYPYLYLFAGSSLEGSSRVSIRNSTLILEEPAADDVSYQDPAYATKPTVVVATCAVQLPSLVTESVIDISDDVVLVGSGVSLLSSVLSSTLHSSTIVVERVAGAKYLWWFTSKATVNVSGGTRLVIQDVAFSSLPFASTTIAANGIDKRYYYYPSLSPEAARDATFYVTSSDPNYNRRLALVAAAGSMVFTENGGGTLSVHRVQFVGYLTLLGRDIAALGPGSAVLLGCTTWTTFSVDTTDESSGVVTSTTALPHRLVRPGTSLFKVKPITAVAAVDRCVNHSLVPTFTATVALHVAKLSVDRQSFTLFSAVASSTAVVAAATLGSLVQSSRPIFLQVSMLALKLSHGDCAFALGLLESPTTMVIAPSHPDAVSSITDDDAAQNVFLAVSAAQGAVVGNVLLVAANGAVLLLLGLCVELYAVSKRQGSLRGVLWRPLLRNASAEVSLPGSMMVMVSFLLQPTVGASVFLLSTAVNRAAASAIALGVAGLVGSWAVSGAAVLKAAYRIPCECRPVAVNATRHKQKTTMKRNKSSVAANEETTSCRRWLWSVMFDVTVVRYKWVPRRRSDFPAVRRVSDDDGAAMYLQRYGPLFEDYRGPRAAGFLMVELLAPLACGCIAGIAPTIGCATSLWLLLGIAVVMLVLSVTRPFTSRLLDVNFAANAIVTVVCAALALAGADAAAAGVAWFQFALSTALIAASWAAAIMHGTSRVWKLIRYVLALGVAAVRGHSMMFALPTILTRNDDERKTKGQLGAHRSVRGVVEEFDLLVTKVLRGLPIAQQRCEALALLIAAAAAVRAEVAGAAAGNVAKPQAQDGTYASPLDGQPQ